MLVPNFTSSQVYATPQYVILSDTSTGSDSAITQRRIYIQDSFGNPVVPSGTTTNYIVWSYSDATITLNLLTRDLAVNIRIDWIDVNDVVLYTTNKNFCFVAYDQNFLYYLSQQIAANSSILADTNYLTNYTNYWSTLRGATNAVEVGNDISNAQACLDRNYAVFLDQNKYF